jgi:hypothetical protein
MTLSDIRPDAIRGAYDLLADRITVESRPLHSDLCNGIRELFGELINAKVEEVRFGHEDHPRPMVFTPHYPLSNIHYPSSRMSTSGMS